MKNLHLILFAVLALGFTACDNDDDYIQLYKMGSMPEEPKASNEINITIAGASYLIKGGFGPYVATCSEPALVEVYTGDDVLYITPLKLGEGQVIITDHNNLIQKFKITITEDTKKLTPIEIDGIVEGGEVSHSSGKTVKEFIEAKISKEAIPVKLGHSELIYNTNISGSIAVYINNVKRQGTFKFLIPEKLFVVELDAKIYLFEMLEGSLERSLGPLNLYLKEDLTKKYQDKFSSAGITKVERIYKLSLF